MKPDTSGVDTWVLLQAYEDLDDPYYGSEVERLRAQILRAILAKHNQRAAETSGVFAPATTATSRCRRN